MPQECVTEPHNGQVTAMEKDSTPEEAAASPETLESSSNEGDSREGTDQERRQEAPGNGTELFTLDSASLQRILRLEQRESVSLMILGGMAIFVALHQTRAIMLPITLSVLMALTLRPVVRRLRRMGLPDPVGAGVILFVVFTFMVLGVIRLAGPAREWITSIPENVNILREKLQAVTQNFQSLTEMTSRMNQFATGEAAGAPMTVEIAQSRISSGITVLSSTGDVLASLLLVVGLTYFFLAFGDSMLNNLLKVLNTYSSKKRTVELVYDVERGIASYLFLVTVINIGLGIVTGFAMWLLGLPNPALWGVMAFVFNYIPIFGALVGVVIITVVSILTFDSLAYAAVAPLVFILLSAVESNLITPPLLGRSMSLNPILVFLALIFWGWIWGIGGALIAVPLLAVAKLACERFEKTRPLAVLMEA